MVTPPEHQPGIERLPSRDTFSLSPAERMDRFSALQRRAFALLTSSPEGYRRFVKRNLRQRRIHAS